MTIKYQTPHRSSITQKKKPLAEIHCPTPISKHHTQTPITHANPPLFLAKREKKHKHKNSNMDQNPPSKLLWFWFWFWFDLRDQRSFVWDFANKILIQTHSHTKGSEMSELVKGLEHRCHVRITIGERGSSEREASNLSKREGHRREPWVWREKRANEKERRKRKKRREIMRGERNSRLKSIYFFFTIQLQYHLTFKMVL